MWWDKPKSAAWPLDTNQSVAQCVMKAKEEAHIVPQVTEVSLGFIKSMFVLIHNKSDI